MALLLQENGANLHQRECSARELHCSVAHETTGPLTVGGSDGEKYLGSGENTYLAMRQIQDSPMHYEKERVEA